MISLDGASLFSSLFAKQHVSTGPAPTEAAEGDRDNADDRRPDVRTDLRQSTRQRFNSELALYDRSGQTNETAAVSEQTTTAAALEYRRAERTTLQIRTQEGDIVKLRFRVKDSLSAESSTVENGETTLAELSVQARSATRLRISVQGDLNSDELAAIQSIVEQASALANEFFTGGTAEAASLASSLDLNPDQLAQVRMRLSLRERLTYTQISSLPAAQPALMNETSPNASDSVDSVTDATAATTETEPSSPVVSSMPESALPDVESTEETTPAQQPLFVDMLSAFEAIAAFLTNLLDALSAVPEPYDTPDTSSESALRFDMSFKLRVFQSILVSVSERSGEEQDDAVPPIIEEALDDLAAQQEPALEEVA